MSSEQTGVVVVGAGISGLACAYRLKSLGIDVTLLEKEKHPGGVMRSERIGEYLIELGPNSSPGSEDLLALVDEIGIEEDLVEGDPKAPAFVCYKRQLFAVPMGAGDFIRSKLLSPAGKFRIMGDLFIPANRADEEESVFSFAARRIGMQAAERMVAPFVAGVYAGDSRNLSVQAAFPRLVNLEKKYGGLFKGSIAKAIQSRRATISTGPTRKRLISFKEGMGHLPQALASRLGEAMIYDCSDLEISYRNPGVHLKFLHAGEIREINCNHIVISTPSDTAATLIRKQDESLADLVGEIYYPPLSVLYLAYERGAVKNPLDGFGFLGVPSDKLDVLGCLYNSSLFSGRTPKGQVLLTVFVGGAISPEKALIEDTELVKMTHDELTGILGISNEPEVIAITRYDRAIPQYAMGHLKRVHDIEARLDGMPWLSIAGNYTHGVSTGDCIKEADRVARRIFEGSRQ